MPTPKPDTQEDPSKKPAPEPKGDLGVPQEGDRGARFVGGPEDVEVKKGTVTI